MAFKASKTGQDTESTEFTAFDGEEEKKLHFLFSFSSISIGAFLLFAVSLSQALPYCEHD